MVDRQVVGLIEILMDPTQRAATQKSTLRFVGDLCDLAGNYLKNRQMRQMMSQQRLWNQLEGFTHQIHGSLDLKETAYAMANDGKRLVGCDRLSVASKVGGRVIVEAVSGQEVVEQQASLIRELTRLCKVVVRSGEDLVCTGNTEGFAPDIRDALGLYVGESRAEAVIVPCCTSPRASRTRRRWRSAAWSPSGCGDEMVGDREPRPERSRLAARLHGTLERAGARQDLPRADARLMGSPWRFFRGRTTGQDHQRRGRHRRLDPGPRSKSLEAFRAARGY